MRCLIAAVLSLVLAGVAQHVHYDWGVAAGLVFTIIFLMAAADGGWQQWHD